jgi:hypothetical protein
MNVAAVAAWTGVEVRSRHPTASRHRHQRDDGERMNWPDGPSCANAARLPDDTDQNVRTIAVLLAWDSLCDKKGATGTILRPSIRCQQFHRPIAVAHGRRTDPTTVQ